MVSEDGAGVPERLVDSHSRLENLGVVGVEEKTIRPDRVDFWVEKPIRGGQALRVAVELKIARKQYGRKRLIEPLETQLWSQYLEPSRCRHGIYIVLKFKDAKRYRYPTKWTTASELGEDLNRRKDEVANRHGLDLACYAIDMTATTRLQ